MHAAPSRSGPGSLRWRRRCLKGPRPDRLWAGEVIVRGPCRRRRRSQLSGRASPAAAALAYPCALLPQVAATPRLPDENHPIVDCSMLNPRIGRDWIRGAAAEILVDGHPSPEPAEPAIARWSLTSCPAGRSAAPQQRPSTPFHLSEEAERNAAPRGRAECYFVRLRASAAPLGKPFLRIRRQAADAERGPCACPRSAALATIKRLGESGGRCSRPVLQQRKLRPAGRRH